MALKAIKKIRKGIFLLPFFILSILFQYTASGDDKDKIKIAVIPKGSTQIFWNSVYDGAMKAASEESVEIIWRGPTIENDKDEQNKILNDFIEKKVDAIVLAPVDYKALTKSLKKANKDGIKTIIIDSAVDTDDYVSFISTDNYKSGILCAQSLCEAIHEKGNIIMMRYNEGSASTTEREQGFLDEIKKFPNVKVLSSDEYGGTTADSCYEKATELLDKYKNLNGIFCPNELTTTGMLKALQISKRAGKIKFTGFDLSYALREALAKGEINSLALQNPNDMGYLGVIKAVDSIRGKPVEKRIDTGIKILTTQMLNEESFTNRILFSK